MADRPSLVVPIGVPAAAPELPAAGQLGPSFISAFCVMRRAAGGPIASQADAQHATPIAFPHWSWRFGRRFRDRLDPPSAFELAGRRHRRPSTDKHVPSRPPRIDGARVVASRNVGMCRQERRPMSASAVRECCELCEHRSPRFPLGGGAGERKGKRSASRDRSP